MFKSNKESHDKHHVSPSYQDNPLTQIQKNTEEVFEDLSPQNNFDNILKKRKKDQIGSQKRSFSISLTQRQIDFVKNECVLVQKEYEIQNYTASDYFSDLLKAYGENPVTQLQEKKS